MSLWTWAWLEDSAGGADFLKAFEKAEPMVKLDDLYGSTLNGGTVANHRRYDLTNQSEDGIYTGPSWMQGYAIGAGVPAGRPLSLSPFTAVEAMRDKLARMLGTVTADGLTHYGYYPHGPAVATDGNLAVILAVREYAAHSGDRGSCARGSGSSRRSPGTSLDRLHPSLGLYRATSSGAAWYYDTIRYDGFNAYYQGFLYKALADMADLTAWVDADDLAAGYRDAASRLRAAINEHLGWRTGPGVHSTPTGSTRRAGRTPTSSISSSIR